MKWLMVVMLCAGCRHVVHPGNVVVIIDSALGDKHVGTSTVREAVRTGLHYWDVVGAGVHLEDDAVAADVTIKGCTVTPDNELGRYDYITGDLCLSLPGDILPVAVSIVAAHEVGHAMGLDHVVNEGAVMYHNTCPIPCPENGLQPADIEEYRRLYRD